MNRSTKHLLIVLALCLAGLAYSQSTLGNMFKLGSSTTANLPASSTYTVGALIYDLDAGLPRYNNGSTWSTFAPGGADYWADGGVVTYSGGSYSTMTTLNGSAIRSIDGGIPLTLAGNTIGSGLQTAMMITDKEDGQNVGSMISFAANSDDRPYFAVSHLFASSLSSGGIVAGTNWHSQSPFHWSIGTGGNKYGTGTVRVFTIGGATVDPYIPMSSQVASGANAYQVAITGARYDFGTSANDYAYSDTVGIATPSYWSSTAVNGAPGFKLTTSGAQMDFGAAADDYAVSDGGGIKTPSFWESTRDFTSGAGLIAPRMRLSGADNTKFSSANAAKGSAGDISYDTSFNRVMLQVDGGSFAPIAQPHLTYGAQTFTTRIIGVSGTTGAPQIAENVTADNSGGTLQTYWASTGTGAVASVLTSLDRTYYAIQPGTEANSRYFGTTATSAATTTLKPIVAARKSPAWCQPVRTGVAITSLRIWAGLVDTGTSTGTSTMNGNGVMFRYDTNVDGNWYLCSKDNTTQNCTNTNIAVATTTTYHLCIQMDSARVMYGFINGVYVASSGTNAPSTNSELAPWVEVQVLAGSTNSIAVGVMQVESL